MSQASNHLLTATIVAGAVNAAVKPANEITGFREHEKRVQEAARGIAWEHLVQDEDFRDAVADLLSLLHQERQ